MPMINGRKVGYGKKGMAKARRAAAMGKKVSYGGAAAKKSKAGGAQMKSTSWKSGTKKAKTAAGQKAHYAAIGKKKKPVKGSANKRKTLRRARAAGKLSGKTAQTRARRYTKR